ncbi:DoxX family protein [Paralimibaculum aggregatum]|uniref:DoxX family protein n=1 Tax=Paralimibaculum aggregatum TaxID=3036245 RepID=A0ABQ6LPG8_9RHOB|nr:DoxX family protein [Limibaculum sp. NKW23]GMG82225.1 DoxX family protein [Limibaculum sp. NKW23]
MTDTAAPVSAPVSAATTPLAIPALRPLYAAAGPLADAGLRVAAGLFLLPHAAQKLFGWFGGYGLEASGQYFETQLGFADGFAAALAAGLVELVAGLALALGLGTRIAAGAIAVMLLVATTVHLPNGFFWTDGGWEYPVLWAILAARFAAAGGGAYSLDRLIGREV